MINDIFHVQDRSDGNICAKKSPPDPCMLPAVNQERPGSHSPFFFLLSVRKVNHCHPMPARAICKYFVSVFEEDGVS